MMSYESYVGLCIAVWDHIIVTVQNSTVYMRIPLYVNFSGVMLRQIPINQPTCRNPYTLRTVPLLDNKHSRTMLMAINVGSLRWHLSIPLTKTGGHTKMTSTFTGLGCIDSQ